MPVNSALALENFNRFSFCRDNGHLRYVAKANKCDDYFSGLQWDPITKRKLERQRRPVLTINKTLATLATIMGEQLENRATISFQPSKDGNEEVAAILNKVYLNIANNNKLDWVESQVADDGFITGRGFFDVRVGFNDHMLGEAIITSMNPRNVCIDPEADQYDPDTWKEVILTKWLTVDDIALFYSKADAKLLESTVGSSSGFPFSFDSIERVRATFGGFRMNQPLNSSSFDTHKSHFNRIRVIERQYKKLRNAWHFIDPVKGDLRLVPENWSKAKREEVADIAEVGLMKKLIQQIRWTVSADHVVLFDEWSPYKHFTVVPYFPFFRHGRTVGIVENLLSPQDQLNKVSSQELHVVNTTANSGWKVKQGSLRNMDIDELETRGAETGLVVELDDTNDLEKITPNQIPQGLDRISAKADEAIKSVSGVSDSLRGFDRADVAAKAIQAKRQAGSLNLAKPFDNLARTRHLVAIRVLDIVQTWYTDERVVQITSGGLVPEIEEVTINQTDEATGKLLNDLTLGEYSVTVTTAPSHKTHQESQFDEAMRLREAGVNIPDNVLIEHSRLNRKSEIAQAINPEPTEAEQRAQQLELQLKEVEIANEQSEAILKRAKAMEAMSKAKKTSQDMIIEAQAADVEGEAEDQKQLEPPEISPQQKVNDELAAMRNKKLGEVGIEREANLKREDENVRQGLVKEVEREEEQERKDKLAVKAANATKASGATQVRRK